MTEGFADQLSEAMGGGRVLTDPDLMEPYRHDRTSWITPGHPRAVAFAETTAQVAAAVKVAAANHVPVIPRGAGSSLCAGRARLDGSLVLSLERMDRVLEVLPDDLMAVVQPGVITQTVRSRSRRSASTTRRTPPPAAPARSAATSPTTPAAPTASSTASRATTCSRSRPSSPTGA